MAYKIEIKNMEMVRAAVMHFSGEVAQAPKFMPAVFKSIQGQSNGAPFIGYLTTVDETNYAQMLLCVPTTKTPNASGIEIMEFEACRAACLTYVGAYDKMQPAYTAMRQYLDTNNLVLAPPCREVYIKGPGMIFKGNERNYITEIVFPLED